MTNIRAMIIDPNLEHIDTLSSELLKKGITSMGFVTGSEALASYEQFQPNLLICEYQMIDGMKGWEIAAEILKDDPKNRPYMIALHTIPSQRNKAVALEFGFNDFFCKPIGLSDLFRWVAKAKTFSLI